MKSNKIITIAILIAWVTLLTITVQSQTISKEMLFRISIPFDFVASGVHLPAGHYSVYHALSPDVILIESDAGRGSAFVLVKATSGGMDRYPTKLVFNKYGSQYFLAQVWTSADKQVHACLKCREEETLAAQNVQPEVRTVTLR